MTEPEDFLARWSRRKRDAKAEPVDRPAGEEPIPADASNDAQTLAHQAGEAMHEDVFDLSRLPSLDSIGPETDISVFMQPGIPAALSRAALRRAWSADPAIRDFIGICENSWDFTADDGMHGFGALDPADAKRLIAHLLGGEDEPAVAAGPEMQDVVRVAEPVHDDASEVNLEERREAAQPEDATRANANSDTPEPGAVAANDVALQNDTAPQRGTGPGTASLRRPHGRALPQ